MLWEAEQRDRRDRGLDATVIAEVKQCIKELRLTTGVRDKNNTKIYGLCEVLRDLRLLQDTIGGARFSLTTTVETPLDAHQHILDKIVEESPRNHQGYDRPKIC